MSDFKAGAKPFNPNAVWVPGAGLVAPASPMPNIPPTPQCTPVAPSPLAGGDTSWEDSLSMAFSEPAFEIGQDPVDEEPQMAEVAKEEKVEEKKAEEEEKVEEKEDVQNEKIEQNDEQESVKEEEKEEEIDDSDEPEAKSHMNLFFMGHVDVGKSTICGNILWLSGMVDKRMIEKYEREAKDANRGSWYLAYVMDTNEEERAKGKTVEVGRAYFETEKRRYTILDAPGHKAYVPNMIQGAVQADVGVLVVSAKTGEFESGFEKNGQTREHAMLAKTLGIKKIIVAINKMDEVAWDPARYEQITTNIMNFLKKDCGYNPKTDLVFLPISGQSGANLRDPVGKDVCPWYDGKPLFDVFDDIPDQERNDTAPLRMTISDKFRDMGSMYISGKIESGVMRKGQNVLIMPNKTQVKVGAILIKSREEEEKEIKRAHAGDSVRIMVSLDESLVQVGFVICPPSKPVDVVTAIIAQIQVKDLVGLVFSAGTKAIMHIHTAQVEVEVEKILNEIDPKTRQPMKKKPRFVKNGSIVTVKIVASSSFCCECFKDYPQLGRFTLRDKGHTVAVGRVERLCQSTN
mmetsp:Transcript_28179/g.70727  ORF Transcript_28179/g.70727 Transcript_28179/m.70727 type:complete len:573 (-) Transcript_28179:552-2270(-)|eukprot:CAMPEP_0177673170 /NCGR_PEP_ID=MMETSP0447-20121125/25781_1 /TAXON_ID=0 /ORGANISM="Stygamoeba regulata, Strain BSH-02190019" /LENGTH=572 /DNA_ID=CAMNT_0019180985 /DNA_START=24 /DNA_END=1742 /DNA_ORIENTATION=+